jgi:rod shape-determining protein MreC
MYGRRSQPRSTGLFLTLCAVMLLLAMLSEQSWAASARGAAKSALAPLESAMTQASRNLDRITSVLGDISALRSENQRLQAADVALRRQVIELDAAAKENASLRQALDFKRTFGHTMVAAQVVGRGPDGFSSTVEIDRGTADGIRPGMIVATGAGLVGRVREAGPHGALVQTLADPRSRVNVYLAKSGLQGTVSGGPTALQLEIEHSLGLKPSTGEWALTSGVGGGYPRGLVVGEVASVTYRPASTSDQALLAWVNEPSSLSLLLVITDFVQS